VPIRIRAWWRIPPDAELCPSATETVSECSASARPCLLAKDVEMKLPVAPQSMSTRAGRELTVPVSLMSVPRGQEGV
jgi:hypothetical protein